MAFATSNIQVTNVGGNLKATTGQWTASLNDVAGTFAIAGGVVYDANFNENLATGLSRQPKVQFTQAQSGNIVTLTLYHQEAVTAGTFIIWHR